MQEIDEQGVDIASEKLWQALSLLDRAYDLVNEAHVDLCARGSDRQFADRVLEHRGEIYNALRESRGLNQEIRLERALKR